MIQYIILALPHYLRLYLSFRILLFNKWSLMMKLPYANDIV